MGSEGPKTIKPSLFQKNADTMDGNRDVHKPLLTLLICRKHQCRQSSKQREISNSIMCNRCFPRIFDIKNIFKVTASIINKTES